MLKSLQVNYRVNYQLITLLLIAVTDFWQELSEGADWKVSWVGSSLQKWIY